MSFSEFLKEKVENKKIVLIGEIHGTKEIPKSLSEFFSRYAKDTDFNIGLEISSDNQEKIDNFLSSGEDSQIKDIFYNIFENDGRRTLEYLELIKEIYNLNNKYNRKIKIICVDISEDFKSEDFQNDRETKIADNIINSLEKQTFVILGDIHASKKILEFSNLKIIPTGYILFKKFKDSFVNINMVPKEGKFYNLTIKEITSDLLPEIKNNYDYEYYLDSVNPATILSE